ncbi:MAG TPA: hypothetical protein VE954_06030 [Oligoflexus sp.]|uniref:hypothetical protein n=1 Tax=Oligoflexus sp. TaxID=1971216 RepID=UPI002D39CC52|nr:hypothetical protein [Oligoflexus sp.]HYX32652.1 hypothetical protein [Oligoflexus sp.]
MNTDPSPDFTAEARSLGYFPFIRFSPLEYLTFKELYGEWIFDLFKRLKDPGRLHPEWAIIFAAAAVQLSRDEVLKASDVHALVTGSEEFMNRRRHIREFNDMFFERVWPKMKEGALDVREPDRSIYLADFERWREKLKARTSEIHGKHKASREASPVIEHRSQPSDRPKIVKKSKPEA